MQVGKISDLRLEQWIEQFKRLKKLNPETMGKTVSRSRRGTMLKLEHPERLVTPKRHLEYKPGRSPYFIFRSLAASAPGLFSRHRLRDPAKARRAGRHGSGEGRHGRAPDDDITTQPGKQWSNPGNTSAIMVTRMKPAMI
jgi:hypothetical protein